MEENWVGWVAFIVVFAFLGAVLICLSIDGLILFIDDERHLREIGKDKEYNFNLYIDGQRKEYKESARNNFIRFCILFFIGLFGVTFGPIKGGTEISKVYHKTYNYTKYNIVSLEKDNSIEGSFTLGCGYIKENKVYYFYTTTNIGYKLEHADSKYTYLVEDNSTTPHIQHIKESNSFYSYYVIYCPEGTIIKDFSA